VTKKGGLIHIVPIDDLRPHDDSGCACWCQPRIQVVDSETGDRLQFPIVIHQAADGRELVEQHGLQ